MNRQGNMGCDYNTQHWSWWVKEATLQTLVTKFENLKISDIGMINDFATKLSIIASKYASLGEAINEHKLVNSSLTSLPRRFMHFVTALEQVLDL